MKFSWLARNTLGQAGIRVDIGEYDGYPLINSLLFDGQPRSFNADRFAAAAVLAFGDEVSGGLSLEKPISPLMASAITKFFSDRWVAPGPILDGPTPLPAGRGKILLTPSDQARHRAANQWGQPRQMSLDVLRSDEAAGHIATMSRFITCSNAWILSRGGEHTLKGLFPYISIALLFAETWQLDEIAVDVSLQGDPDLGRVRTLLAACRVGLSEMGQARKSGAASELHGDNPAKRGLSTILDGRGRSMGRSRQQGVEVEGEW